MQPAPSPMRLPTVDRLLPPRAPAFEQLCRLAQQDPGWIGLVVESLLHAPLGLLIDQRFLPNSEAGVWQRLPDWQFVPMLIRHRDHGIHEFCRAVFSRTEYMFEFPPPLGEHTRCFNFVNGMTPLKVCADPEMEPYALVVDPTWPHSLLLRPSELRECLMAWHLAPGSAQAQYRNFEFGVASAAMRTRLREFLPQMPSVEQAYVGRCALATQPNQMQQTLFLRGADDASLARIRKALPLLNLGLPAEDAMALATLAPDRPLWCPLAYEA